MGNFLVVGGDSLVGGGTVKALTARGHNVISTTRRKGSVRKDRIFLDFEDESTYRVPQSIDYAFVIAAATNYDRCESDPQAEVINVKLIPSLVRSLLNQGMFVTFISTNAVFGGERPWPHEDDSHDPHIAYAQQKSDGEKAILEFAASDGTLELLNITRLTKILEADVPPIPGWIKDWNRGKGVTPFEDLVFAPMSIDFVSNSLATIGEKRIRGNLHLSGAENISYVQFAHAIAKRLGVEAELIKPTTATEQGIHIAFKPTYSGLGMTRTTEHTGIKPQKIDDLIEALFANNAD